MGSFDVQEVRSSKVRIATRDRNRLNAICEPVTTSLHPRYEQQLTTTMALNRYKYDMDPIFGGFDDFFSPCFIDRSRDPFSVMPVIHHNFMHEDGMRMLHSSPGYEIIESDDKYQIAVDVPGVTVDDLDIQLQAGGRVLHICGGRKVLNAEGVMSTTNFEKRFTIGDNIDTDKISAKLELGVLTLTAPKLGKTTKEPKKIHITVPHLEKKKEEA